MKIVYRVVGYGFDSALFAEQEKAERLVRVRRALDQSRTWGEFRKSLPAGEWDTEFAESFDEVPSDDDPFAADSVPGFADGDYPEWLLQTQLDWFPKELSAKYGGELYRTTLNGDALLLPADRIEDIAADLRALGHTVERTELDII